MKFSSIPLLTLLIFVLPATPLISSAANLLRNNKGIPFFRYDAPETQLPRIEGKGGDAGEGKPGGAASVDVGGTGEDGTVHWHNKGNSFSKNYKYDASETQLVHDLNVALLLEKDMKAGNKMRLPFTQSSNQGSLLPRELANSIPFSSAKLDDILNRFGIKSGSEDAEVMKRTLMDCEAAGIKGEEKQCATSWESMVDFVTSMLGEKVEAVSSEEVVEEKGMQEYTIGAGVEKVGEEKVVVCHRLEYPYAVFYCHKLEKTMAYKVPLEGADGMRVKAVVICHADTSQWNPKHAVLRVLKVKPGTVPVCHSLPDQDDLVWVPKSIQIL